MNAVYIIFIVIVALGVIFYLLERNKQLQDEVETLHKLKNVSNLNAKNCRLLNFFDK